MPLLAFGFCALAFGDALGAGLVDVALGYANDCALISENHTMPDAVEPFARIRLMRAAAHSERGEYALALAKDEKPLSLQEVLGTRRVVCPQTHRLWPTTQSAG